MLCRWLFFLFFIGSFATADAATWIAGSWNPPTIQLVPGGDVTSTLSVWGRFGRAGYSVRLYAENGSGAESSVLQHGTTSSELSYDVSMVLSGVVSPARVAGERLRLHRPLNNDVRVRFAGFGEHEVSSASPHQVELSCRLATFSPISKMAGRYSDQITAVLVVN